jgi:hypothetical protein
MKKTVPIISTTETTMITRLNTLPVLALAFLVAACTPTDNGTELPSPSPAEERHNDSAIVEETMTVYKTPWCGCCTLWAEQAIDAGFDVEMHDVESLHPIKEELGVPPAMGSCHTAKIAGYFIEGHVPFDDIRRLLAERPHARGLTVPGMPLGSPGMEQGNRRQAYDVYLVDETGHASVYNHYPASPH